MTRHSSRRSERGEHGAAAVWVLVCAAVLAVLAGAVVVRTLAVLARHRAESAADFAALAAAGRIGVGGVPCTAAADLARVNGARLTACRLALAPGARSGTVIVAVAVTVRLPLVGPVVVRAAARAARLPAVTPAAPVPASGHETRRGMACCRSSESLQPRVGSEVR